MQAGIDGGIAELLNSAYGSDSNQRHHQEVAWCSRCDRMLRRMHCCSRPKTLWLPKPTETEKTGHDAADEYWTAGRRADLLSLH